MYVIQRLTAVLQELKQRLVRVTPSFADLSYPPDAVRGRNISMF